MVTFCIYHECLKQWDKSSLRDQIHYMLQVHIYYNFQSQTTNDLWVLMNLSSWFVDKVWGKWWSEYANEFVWTNYFTEAKSQYFNNTRKRARDTQNFHEMWTRHKKRDNCKFSITESLGKDVRCKVKRYLLSLLILMAANNNQFNFKLKELIN